MMRDLSNAALLVIDVQRGFDHPDWGIRNNPECEKNVAALIERWRDRNRPLVYVRHDSVSPASPLRPGSPGNELRAEVSGEPDLLVTKSVNSAFYGTPDLHQWLQANDIATVVITGVQTNMCCETTARMAGNLGYDTLFVLDATHTFDLVGPDGAKIPADTLSDVTSANLNGEFATVVSTQSILDEHFPAVADT